MREEKPGEYGRALRGLRERMCGRSGCFQMLHVVVVMAEIK